MSEGKKIVSGLKWTSIQYAVDTIFRFSIRLVLAKLLLPEQFGLIAMCSIFLAVADAASELGMSAALIQKKENKDAEVLYPTAFSAGVMWGILLFLIMSVIVAPLASNFYSEPLLRYLIPALSISILFKPFTMIQTVVLTRDMNFKKIGRILNISSLFAGILSILAAFLGWGVWALVMNAVLAPLISLPLFYIGSSWKLQFGWDKRHFKEIFGFGAYSTITGVFSTVTYNVDNLMIGKLLGKSLLGSYTLSFSLTEQLRQIISSVLNKVMYPVFGQNQDNKVKLRDYFINIVNINAIVIYPLMGFLVIFSKEIIVQFFGEKWAEAVIPLQILAIAMMVHLLVNSFTSLVRGLGKPNLEMKIIMGLTLGILIPGLYIGISYYGIVGASYAVLLNKIALVIVGAIVLKREIDLQIVDLFKAIIKPVISVVLSGMIIYFLKCHFDSILMIVVLGVLFFGIYAFLIILMEKEKLLKILKYAK